MSEMTAAEWHDEVLALLECMKDDGFSLLLGPDGVTIAEVIKLNEQGEG